MIGTLRTTAITTGTGRRVMTVSVVVASLLVGLFAIRVAAAWVSVSAPLETTPATVQSIQARLTDQTARAATLEDRLVALTTHAQAVQDALTAAQARVATDSAHADDLSAQLAAAKARLAALERSIRDANRVRLMATVRTASGASSGEGEGDD
jgi:septal ring factor EnvC (AmiA/AmiB activator)